MTFPGFPDGPTRMVTLPESVFSELVAQIDDLAELQVTLVALWRLSQMRSATAPWVTRTELSADNALSRAMSAPGALDAALARAVTRGTLLRVVAQRADGTPEERYFANGPRGRAAVAAFQRGVAPERQLDAAQRPNIFTLYEQNIGPLTALLAEELREAEETYPAQWIEEAFRAAVRRNVRHWKYIHAILERWQTEGRDEVHRRNHETDPKRYSEGEYADFIQH